MAEMMCDAVIPAHSWGDKRLRQKAEDQVRARLAAVGVHEVEIETLYENLEIEGHAPIWCWVIRGWGETDG